MSVVCISWKKIFKNKRSVSKTLVYVDTQVSAEHLHLIFHYQPHQSSFTTVYIDVALLFICLNVFACINCKGNSVLTRTFPAEPHWLQNRLQSQPAFLFVEMAVIGARLWNAYGWSPGKTLNHTFINTHAHTHINTTINTLLNQYPHLWGLLSAEKAAVYPSRQKNRGSRREKGDPPPPLLQSVIKMTANTKWTSHLVCKYQAL